MPSSALAVPRPWPAGLLCYSISHHAQPTRNTIRTASRGGLLTKFQGQNIDTHEGAPGTASYQAFDQHSPKPYAILEYGKSQAVIASVTGTPDCPLWLTDPRAVCRFDVSRAAELTIHIYLDVSNHCPQKQDVFLGLVGLSPLDGATMTGLHWLDLQCGAGKICFDLNYACDVNRSNFRHLSSSSNAIRVIKKDTQQQYAERTIKTTKDTLFLA
ncbi:hypothetical protein GGR58DRAFT_193559 [Xylaria digitata]|nr:hypothetical protein GGR58DRAFT_193559 [Xylaria digitata]